MKNKSGRVNSMKLKKAIAASLAISLLFAFTGCGNSSDSAATENTKQETASATNAGDTSAPNEKLDDLYQQENQIFADHKNVWDKVFGFMSKNPDDAASNENYADFLANTIESNKASFSEEEFDTLNKDIETIRGIEEEIARLEKEIAASDSSGSTFSGSADSTGVFHDFKGKDLDGNDVDDSLFAQNKVTVVNFWFSGCKPCVEELSKLNELNDKLKEMGGEVVGINTDTLDDNQDGIKEAKEILKAKGASYKNLTFDSDSTVGKYAGDIMAFPTTVLVDKDGNIVGDPFMGGIDDPSNYEQLMKQIQSVLDQK
ncbi:TlpA disulfide reductase family protein [Laedolimicola intestinihominis]|uniref:TlpA disulfide reductase family protein n=1 Tax=Laedolimicola intestinihominis TaxID=3133166 RepID=A0ABV1FGL7_9FIRM